MAKQVSRTGTNRCATYFALVFAALALSLAAPSFANASTSVSWAGTTLKDHVAPYASPAHLVAASCPTTGLCVAADDYGNVLTTTNPTGGAGAWSEAVLGEHREIGRAAISCPTTALCVLGESGRLITATNPTGGAGAWTKTEITHEGFGANYSGVSCASATLCAAVAEEYVLISTTPTGGAGAWTLTKIDAGHQLVAISCIPGLCVAADAEGGVVYSTEPTAGAGAWHRVDADGAHQLRSISCPTTTLCVATDSEKRVITTTEPTGEAVAWSAAKLEPEPGNENFGLEGVSCATATLCVVVDGFGRPAYATNPTGGKSAWTLTNRPGRNLAGISCAPTSSTCVAVGYGAWDDELAVTTNPAGAEPAWHEATINSDGKDELSAVACASSALCVAVDESGNVAASSEPASGPWTVSHVDSSFGEIGYLKAVSCPTTKLCVAVDGLGDALYSTNPTGGVGAWHLTKVDASLNLRGVSCPTESLCVGVDQEGNVVTTTNPTGSSGAWTTTKVDGTNEITSVSCGSEHLCAAADAVGNIVASTNPTGGVGAWKAAAVGTSGAVSCTTAFCVVPAHTGFLVSTEPAGGAATWHAALPTGVVFTNEVACASTTFCIGTGFAEEEESFVGRLYVSTNPTAGVGSWTLASTGSLPEASGITCATATFCAGVSYNRESVSVGTPHLEAGGEEHKEEHKEETGGGTTSGGSTGGSSGVGGSTGGGGTTTKALTAAEIASSLAALLTPTGKAAALKAVLKSGGYTLTFAAPGAGKLVISWYEVPKGAHLAKAKPKPILVASVSASFSGVQTLKLKLRLTPNGKKLLKKTKRIVLVERATFTASAGATATKTKMLTLHG